MKFFRVLLLFASLFTTAYAQRYPINTISLNDGLPQSVVYKIFQDSNGFIWFATQDGVGKYDGSQFENFSLNEGLIDNMTRDFAEDGKGRIWVATDKGISIINSSDDSILNLKEFEGMGFRSVLRYNKKQILLGSTNNGLFIVEDTTIVKQYSTFNGLVNNRVYSLEKDDFDNIYVGTDVGLSIIKNDQTIQNYTTKEGLLSNKIRSLELVNNKILWIGGYGNGLTKLENGKLSTLTVKDGFPNNKVNGIKALKNGSLLIATDGDGGVILSPDNKIQLINRSLGLKNVSIQSVLEDNEGNLWFGTWGSGAYLLRHMHILLYDDEEGLPESNVTSVIKDLTDNLWVGTNNQGLVKFEGSKKIYFNEVTTSQQMDRIYALAVDQENTVWVGTDHGLKKIKNNKVESIGIEPLFNSTIRSISIDKEGKIWIGIFGKGLVIFEKSAIKWIRRTDGLLNDSVFTIAQRKNGETWVGSDGGISIFKNGNLNRSLTAKDGLITNRISSLFEDSKSNMWIGTYKTGVLVFEKDSIKTFNTDHGLSNNLVTFIEEDVYGTVWVGSKKGVNRFIGDDIRIYSVQNGLISNETNSSSSFYKAPYLFVGTVDGLAQIDLSKEIPNSTKPPVFISSVSVWNNEIDLKRELFFNYDENYLSFDYVGLNFSNSQQVQYKIRLLGLEDQWNVTSKKSIQYTNLPSGKYTFEVIAINGFGIESEQPARLDFEIVPPYWDTFLFKFGLFLSFIGFVIITVKYNGKRLTKQNAELERMVKNRTEELKKSEELFRLISENAGGLIAVCKLNGETIYASPSFKDILNYENENLIGKKIGDIVATEDNGKLLDVVKAIKIQNNLISTTEVNLKHNNGNWLTFIVTVTSFESNEDNELQFIMVGHDISIRKKTEVELLQSKLEAESANVAKSRFLASMSHELRTPLNAILGFAQIMSNASDVPEKYRNYVQIMHNSGEHLLSMINDILDLSKIEAGRMELKKTISSMHDFLVDLENMMQIQSRENKLTLQFESSNDFPNLIHTDFNKLRQILINLIGNAIKYTEKGSIWVICSVLDTQTLVIDVKDTGPGIPQEQLDQIFDAFHQAHEANFSKGTGLGLTISMKIAQLLGGRITVSSEVGKGSTFRLILPYDKVNQNEIVISSADKIKIKGIVEGGKIPTVVIVDDIDENRIILTEYLQQIGFNCYDYTLAIDALPDLVRIKPDIILTDIVMPKMNGKEFLDEIKKIDALKGIPVIAISASIFAENNENLKDYGFNEFLYKPIEMEHLLTVMAQFIQVDYERNVHSHKETQKALTTSIENEIERLNQAVRSKLAEALELLDEETIYNLIKQLDNTPFLKQQLTEAIREKNYRILLSLSEQLNP